jgi:PAS domain S-box-containing protein
MEPHRDHEGNILQWCGVSIDIDEEVRAQEALRRSERQLQQLVDAVPVMIWSTTPEGRPSYVNKRFTDITGATLEDITAPDGSFNLSVIHPDDRAATAEMVGHSFTTGIPYVIQYRQLRRDGAYHWTETRAEALRDETGAVLQWYGVSVDIDDQVRLYSDIEEREAKIRRLVDSDIIGIVIWDLDGRLIDANDAFLRMVQCDREDLQAGLRWFDMTPPEWQDVHAREEAEELKTTGKMQAREKEFFRKDGSRVPVLIGAACFEGQSRQGVAYILDLTERKRAEAALRDRERELSQLVDMVPVHIRRLTPQGEPTFFNKRLRDFFGLDVVDLDNAGTSRLATAMKSLVHPDDRDTLLEMFRQSLVTGERYSGKYRMRRADGAYCWVDTRAEPLRDENGAIVQWYVVSIDIDDEVRAQEALREREQELSQLVNVVPAHIRRLTPEGEPIFFNKRLKDFYGLGDVSDLDKQGMSRLSATIQTLVHADDATSLLTTARRSFAAGEPFSMKYRTRRADGVYRWVDTRTEPLRNQSGAIVHWYVISIDIDDEVRAQEALRLASDKLAKAAQAASLAELSASIAHEVNQPLAAIAAYSHACQRWLGADPPNLERAQLTVERIIRDVNSAAEVVSRIRALFRQAVEPRNTTTLASIITEARNLMTEEATRRHIRIEEDIESDLPPIAFDRVQLQQVLINLIGNGMDAMDASAGDKVLRIRVRRIGDTVRTEISDRGQGIDFPDKIFDPFFTTKEHGMGMGLAICRSIVESHGGRLWAENNKPHGATFIFTLPIELPGAP